ncbi:helix-turn-helix DNA-binding domain protein [Mycobacterium phage Jeeves]|uniref:Helix-turn-helix DNA-binding domain protein n=1 Tax=Mycobacterium phage Jeeves TaxID=2652402 RepID=A0A5J6T490_9CAUD|nr:HTH DNA binding protein [Mycobacterium phage Jeeves]QFG04527.1 helix-turn-helix DNA-binding domain protein [Mycobacterium phage Jeeves]
MSATTEINESIETLTRGIEIVLNENGKLLRLLDVRDETINSLKGQLDVARRSFGDAFVYGSRQTGPYRANKPKLSPQDATDIRQAHAGGMKQADLARNYGVNPATVSRIVNRVYY